MRRWCIVACASLPACAGVGARQAAWAAALPTETLIQPSDWALRPIEHAELAALRALPEAATAVAGYAELAQRFLEEERVSACKSVVSEGGAAADSGACLESEGATKLRVLQTICGGSAKPAKMAGNSAVGAAEQTQCESWCFSSCVLEPSQRDSCRRGCSTHCQLALGAQQKDDKQFYTFGADMDKLQELKIVKDTDTDQNFKHFVRPCSWVKPGGDPPTSNCCGDRMCDGAAGEDKNTCPADCGAGVSKGGDHGDDDDDESAAVQLSTLFGQLTEMPQQGNYHCELTFDRVGWAAGQDATAPLVVGSLCGHLGTAHRPSAWLQSIVSRTASGSLPFEMLGWPGTSSADSARRPHALDLGCGLGQDTRNLAMVGFDATGVDVSSHVVRVARSLTDDRSGRLAFVASDAFVLPEPITPLTFVFDGTVYCSLRDQYLSRIYELWGKILPKGGTTTMLVQCWFKDLGFAHDVKEQDMEADFAGGGLQVVHKEQCLKNQDWGAITSGKQHDEGADGRDPDAWCYYLRRTL
eukprot:SAG22_NODE_46_length_24705_cov_89.861010_1_plen_527_part_00